MKTRIVIIGAGAAGCFCAIHLRWWCPEAEVTLIEAQNRPLAKVAITGGGRCNLTNSFRDIPNLGVAYPRGDKLMKRALRVLSPSQTEQWWEDQGVALVTQEDQCVFPQSQDAMQIVGTLTRLMQQTGVKLWTNHRVTDIQTDELSPDSPLCEADYVVVTTGGSPRAEGLSFLAHLPMEMVDPVPSLFTFNIPDQRLRQLMGVVVEGAYVQLAGTRFSASGPLLVTHWGMSGPAILRLSSYAARHLAEQKYKATLLVNWMGQCNEEEVRAQVGQLQQEGGQRLMANYYPTHLTARLWHYLMERAGIDDQTRWNAIGKKQLNRLVATLTADQYSVEGQSRHKEEFVTCGGVALSNVNPNTLECKQLSNLYLAGEVLDIDAITGGFNLQAAWSTGYVCAKSIAEKIKKSEDIGLMSSKFRIFATKR